MIRPYAANDVDAVLDAWYAASLIAHPFLDEEFLAEERVRTRDEWLPAADVTVAVADGSVVGFLAQVGNEVGAIFVHPDHQGAGHGRALMDDARASRPFLELDVFEANHIGRRFYDAYGFRLVDRRHHDETDQTMLRLRLD